MPQIQLDISPRCAGVILFTLDIMPGICHFCFTTVAMRQRRKQMLRGKVCNVDEQA